MNFPSKPWWASQSTKSYAHIAHRWRAPALTVALITIIAAILLGVAQSNPYHQTKQYDNGSVMEPATRTALAAGCYGIVTHESAPKSEIGWANTTLPLTWAFTPSTGGNFSPFPYQGPPVVPDNPKIEFTEAQAVSMLYRGWIVIWYQTTVPPKETLYAAEQIASLPNNERVLLAQWTNKKKPTWKTGQQWWITGWNKAQPCSKFSLQVVKEFRNANPVTSAPGHQIPLNNPGPKALIVRTQRI